MLRQLLLSVIPLLLLLLLLLWWLQPFWHLCCSHLSSFCCIFLSTLLKKP
jgi:hypothetical protein